MTQRTALIFATLAMTLGIAPTALGAAATQSTTAPTLVTLKLDRVPATQAIRSLFKLGEIPTNGIDSPRFEDRVAGVEVTCDFVRRPFALAMLDLFRQCGLEPDQSPAAGQPMMLNIRPVSRPATTQKNATPPAHRPLANVGNGVRLAPPGPSWIDAPAFAAGPFVLVAREARRSSVWDFSGDAVPGAQRELTLGFRVLHDPNVRVWAMSDRIEVTEARDEHGNSLLSPTRADPVVRPVQISEETAWDLPATLAHPPADAKKVTLLRGRLKATIVTRVEPTDLLDAGGKIVSHGNAGGHPFTIARIESNASDCNLFLTLDYPASGEVANQSALASVHAMFHRNAFRACDAAGNIYWIRANITNCQENRFYEVTINFRGYQAFQNDPKPATQPTKITWLAPVEVEDINVPFEVKDLDLP